MLGRAKREYSVCSMVRGLILSFVLLLSTVSAETASASYFSTRLARALPGDYIVANQPGSYCVLILRSRENDKIVLEEIDIPDYSDLHLEPT